MPNGKGLVFISRALIPAILHATEGHGDGTFRSVPLSGEFKQLFTFHVVAYGKVYHCLTQFSIILFNQSWFLIDISSCLCAAYLKAYRFVSCCSGTHQRRCRSCYRETTPISVADFGLRTWTHGSVRNRVPSSQNPRLLVPLRPGRPILHIFYTLFK